MFLRNFRRRLALLLVLVTSVYEMFALLASIGRAEHLRMARALERSGRA